MGPLIGCTLLGFVLGFVLGMLVENQIKDKTISNKIGIAFDDGFASGEINGSRIAREQAEKEIRLNVAKRLTELAERVKKESSL